MNPQTFSSPSPFELFLPQASGKSPLICMTPILGRLAILEDLFFERRLARFFAGQGFAVALIHRPIFEFDPRRGLEQVQRYLEESIERNQKVLDGLVSHPSIDRQRMGTFGISFGSIVNALWAAKEFRLRAHVFALTGGNLPEIFVTSRDPLMRSYYQAMKMRCEGNDETLRKQLCETLTLDPLNAASAIPPSSSLVVLARFDRVIRFHFGLEFLRRLRKPEKIFLPFGHYGSLLALPFLKWLALHFFQRKFFKD